MNEWFIYRGQGEPHDDIARLPAAPRWRAFGGGPPIDPPAGTDVALPRRLGDLSRATSYRASSAEIELVNAALYLRRPLLVTGKPGTGKSTLAYNIAHELRLGPVLKWPVTSRSTREEGLYQYDALARLQDASRISQLARRGQQPGRPPEPGGPAGSPGLPGPPGLPGSPGLPASPARPADAAPWQERRANYDIGRYIRLGPLGTALLPYRRPRVLLIDELDKSDIDLPNDLLTVFEDGRYEIPELTRIADELPAADVLTYDGDSVRIQDGRVECQEFPLVIITSNGERDFPPAFLRRCLRLRIEMPDRGRLREIVEAHLGTDHADKTRELIEKFISRREHGDLATDQLLNAIYLMNSQSWPEGRDALVDKVLSYISQNVE